MVKMGVRSTRNCPEVFHSIYLAPWRFSHYLLPCEPLISSVLDSRVQRPCIADVNPGFNCEIRGRDTQSMFVGEANVTSWCNVSDFGNA